MSQLEEILRVPPMSEEDQRLDLNRSKNMRLKQIEKRASEAIFISDHYNEEDKGIIKESKTLLRKKSPMSEQDQMYSIVDIKNSIVENGGAAREQENLITDKLPELRNELNEVSPLSLGFWVANRV